LLILIDSSGEPSPVAAFANIPEEDIWLAKQKSKRNRRAYKLDVEHFMRTLMIRSCDELRRVDQRAVITGERIMREVDGAASSTVDADSRRSVEAVNRTLLNIAHEAKRSMLESHTSRARPDVFLFDHSVLSGVR